MEFTALGGTDCVGANCYYVEIGGVKLLLDCGKGIINNRATYGPNFTHIIPNKIPSESVINAVLISHGHFDHIGYLPEFTDTATAVPAYATYITKELAEYLMLDKIAAAEKTKLEEKIRSVTAKQNAVNNIIPKSCMRPFSIKDITVTFYNAGHLPGAAMVHVQSKSDGSLLYTGDFLPHSTELLPEMAIPDNLTVDTLIVCGTHAKHPHYIADNTLDTMAEAVFTRLFKRRPVFIPARELTKGVEIAMYMSKIMRDSGAYFNIFADDTIYALATRLSAIGMPVISEHWRRWPQVLNRGKKPAGIYIGAGSYSWLFEDSDTINAVLSLHADYRDCASLIWRLKPKNALIVHSPPDTKSHDAKGNTMLSQDCANVNIIYPAEGQTYTF